jgi:hypothetical protein
MSDPSVIWSPTLASGVPIKAGGSAFLSPPAMSEVNASSDQNQVVALANRRTSQIDNTLSQFGYVAAGARPQASLVSNLQTRINLLRGDAGVAPFAFTPVSSGTRIRAQDWLDLRTALDFTPVPPACSLAGILYAHEKDNVYITNVLTPYNNVSGGYPNNSWIGKHSTNTSGGGDRWRLMVIFNVPSGASALGSYRFDIALSGWLNQIEAFSPQFFAANSALTGGSSWWTNRDHDLGSGTYGNSASQAIAVPGSLVASRAGSTLCIVLGEDAEMSSSGGMGSINNKYSGFQVNTSQSPPIALTQTFGF